MATFDIIIKGINPERTDETDEIRTNSAKALQIDVAKLDELLAQPNGACIRRGAPEQDAINYQRTLSKLGLICLYSPTKKLTNLELIPMAEEVAETSVICPHCEHEMPIEEEVKAEKCAECGIDIAKFLEQQRQHNEREAIKAKLLASQNILKVQEAKKQQEDAEKQRKLDLENDVLQELGVAPDAKKPLNVKLLAISGGLIVSTVIGSYFFSQPKPKSSPTATTSLATGAETTSSGSTVQIALKNGKPLSAQEAMQKTHDQAAQVLNGFGLDADAFANAGNSGGEAIPPTEEMLSEMATATPSISTSVNSTTPTETRVSLSAKTTTPSQSTASPELLTAQNYDITWDKFLAQNSKILLERQLPEKAAKLSTFIIENDVYVAAIGELLHAAQQAKQTKLVDDYLAALDVRLASLSAEQQAVYFAQASRYLAIENGTNRLLTKAENLLSSLPIPEQQLNVILKLAVVYSKVGNITTANNYFNKINTLLTATTNLESQAILRANVAVAYQEINNAPVAAQWLSSIEPLIKQLKPETIRLLMISYAKCNQWQSALNLLAAFDAKQHDAWLYRAIESSLQAGFVTNAFELQKSLQAPVYKVLANVLIAEYSPAATEFLAAAEQAVTTLSPSEKIIVASQLVDYYGKLKNSAKTEMFVTMSQETLASLPASNEKDALLEAVIRHYVHGFQIKAANNLLIAIQSVQLKMRLNIEINQLAEISGLLK